MGFVVVTWESSFLASSPAGLIWNATRAELAPHSMSKLQRDSSWCRLAWSGVKGELAGAVLWCEQGFASKRSMSTYEHCGRSGGFG